MSIQLVPIVVCVLGGLVYLLSPSAKPAELGRIAFAVGGLAALMAGAHSCSIH